MKMTLRKRKNKLNQKTLESLREPGMYFFNDASAIAVKVTKNQRKSFLCVLQYFKRCRF